VNPCVCNVLEGFYRFPKPFGHVRAFSDDIVNTKLYKQRLYCICNSTCFRYEVSEKCFVTLGNATGVGE